MQRVMEECDSMSSKRRTILMVVLMLLGGGYFLKLHLERIAAFASNVPAPLRARTP
jgi:hypothetical protein